MCACVHINIYTVYKILYVCVVTGLCLASTENVMRCFQDVKHGRLRDFKRMFDVEKMKWTLQFSQCLLNLGLGPEA